MASVGTEKQALLPKSAATRTGGGINDSYDEDENDDVGGGGAGAASTSGGTALAAFGDDEVRSAEREKEKHKDKDKEGDGGSPAEDAKTRVCDLLLTSGPEPVRVRADRAIGAAAGPSRSASRLKRTRR